LLLFIFLAFWLQPQYQATATILRRPSSMTKDVIVSTVASGTEEQIEVVQGRVMTLDTLQQLVREFDPYPTDTVSSVARKAQRILQDTSLEKVDAVTFKPTSDDSNAFSLHYNNPDRERSAAMAQRLADLFLTYDQRQRTQAAGEAATFLQQQASNVTREIAAVDGELAKLKTAEGDALPELRDQNQGEIDRAEHELDALQQQTLEAENKESQLVVQLGQMSPNLMTQSGDLTDVATVRAQLAEAEQRYTPEHPEVKRLKRALQLLMQNGGGSALDAAASANNPQYVLTATELASTRRELVSLRAQTTRQQEKVNNYEQLLRRTPMVERTEAEILRRRQSLQNQYQQIQDRLQNAQAAQNFESEQRGERFVMLRAPFASRSPVYPNRIGLISLGLLLGLGLSAAAVVIAESADPNVRNVADLPQLEGMPVLGTIPVIRNPSDRRLRRLVISAYGFGYTVAAVVVGAVVAAALRNQ
jgi:uncharacterized protein involved in exopolysaccharide biosynthesis